MGTTGDLRGRTALVTGATGFIGGAVCRRLAEAGAVVHGVSRRAGITGGACSAWWRSDLSEPAEVDAIFAAAKPDIVFHLASFVSGTRDVGAVVPMLRSNLLSAVNVLVGATAHACARVVLAGSLEEPQPGAWPIPASPYAAAKHAASAYGRMFHALYGTPAVILRVFMVYGPGQLDDKKLVPYVTTSLLRGDAPALSSGTRPVDWVYVEDVVDAFVAAAVAHGVEGRTLEVGSGSLVTVREVVEKLVRLVDPAVVPRFGAVAERPLEQVRVADVAATAEALGWRPRTSLDEGLRRTVEAYRHLTRRCGDETR